MSNAISIWPKTNQSRSHGLISYLMGPRGWNSAQLLIAIEEKAHPNPWPGGKTMKQKYSWVTWRCWLSHTHASSGDLFHSSQVSESDRFYAEASLPAVLDPRESERVTKITTPPDWLFQQYAVSKEGKPGNSLSYDCHFVEQTWYVANLRLA